MSLRWEKIKAFMNDDADQKETGQLMYGGLTALRIFQRLPLMFSDYSCRFLIACSCSINLFMLNYSTFVPEFTLHPASSRRPCHSIPSYTSLSPSVAHYLISSAKQGNIITRSVP